MLSCTASRLVRVTDPRYRPRDLARNSRQFGRDPDIEWLPATTLAEQVLQRAAELQHVYAQRIRERITSTDPAQVGERGPRPRSLKAYARLSGTNYDRLLKLLRGEIVLRLEDLAMADLIVGTVSEIARHNAHLAQLAQREKDHEEGLKEAAKRRNEIRRKEGA